MVGEVTTLVAIDEATTSWENLEFARIIVRLLKSYKVGISKGFQINGQVYNISFVEEKPKQGVGVCKCSNNHYVSSDSVSSMESFVEETVFLARSCDEGSENVDRVLRRTEEAREGGKDRSSLEKKWKHLEECY